MRIQRPLSQICRLCAWSWQPEAGGGGSWAWRRRLQAGCSEDGAVTERWLTAACRQQGGCGTATRRWLRGHVRRIYTHAIGARHGWLQRPVVAWFSICNSSMSSAHKLRAVEDGKQFHMASWKMLHLAACVGLWPHAAVLVGSANEWWCGPFVWVWGWARWANARPVLPGADDGNTLGDVPFLGSVVKAPPVILWDSYEETPRFLGRWWQLKASPRDLAQPSWMLVHVELFCSSASFGFRRGWVLSSSATFLWRISDSQSGHAVAKLELLWFVGCNKACSEWVLTC
jgi:hypothetical protein